MPVPKQECYFLKMVDEDDLVFTKLGTFKKLGFFGTFFLEMYLHIVKSTQMPYFYRRWIIGNKIFIKSYKNSTVHIGVGA